MFSRRAEDLRNFVITENRFPKQNVQMAAERTLAWWMKRIKQRQRCCKDTKPLNQEQRDLLGNIPGRTPARYERNPWSGTRKARRGFEAKICVGGKQYYGPARKSQQVARQDLYNMKTYGLPRTRVCSCSIMFSRSFATLRVEYLHL